MKLTFNNNKASILRGEVCPLLIQCEGVKDFHQVQVEIISAGTKNPGGALGFGTVANPISDDIEVDVQTQSLALGLYEIALVRFHTKQNSPLEKVDFVKGVAFDRIIFTVNSVFDAELSQDQVAAVCTSREQALEVEFNSGIELPHNNGAQRFSCFVFVKYLLLGRRTRFNKFEVLPYSRGLDSKDHLELINEFFKLRTETGLKFNYSDDAMRLSQQQQPVSIIHFPNVIASDADTVQRYCEEQTNLLLNVLALTRGSKGEAFDINCL